MQNTVTPHAFWIAIGSLAGGCMAVPPEHTVTVTQEIESCPWSVCSNSPEIAHYGLWEANVFGEKDTNGISIKTSGARAALTKGNFTYQLYVEHGRIFGVNKLGTISGTNLIGSEIELLKNGLPFNKIRIAGVRSSGVSFVAGTPSPVEVYTMLWENPAPYDSYALCNSVIEPTPDNKTFELLGMKPEETLVFEGDRIDAAKKTMSTTADNSWFNFGCAGHTLAKLHLTRNTISSQPVPDWAQRQATLKMLTADYCGTGVSFTLAGEPIAWKGGLQRDYPSGARVTTLEARWSELGARCLGVEPRMRSSQNPAAAIEFPDVFQDIYSRCPALPDCAAPEDTDSMDGTRIVSVNREP